jgi:hypothetical protein
MSSNALGIWVGFLKQPSQVKVVGFADDTTVSFSSKDISHLVESLEHEATRVLDYMSRNKLVANAKKTGFFLIKAQKVAQNISDCWL